MLETDGPCASVASTSSPSRSGSIPHHPAADLLRFTIRAKAIVERGLLPHGVAFGFDYLSASARVLSPHSAQQHSRETSKHIFYRLPPFGRQSSAFTSPVPTFPTPSIMSQPSNAYASTNGADNFLNHSGLGSPQFSISDYARYVSSHIFSLDHDLTFPSIMHEHTKTQLRTATNSARRRSGGAPSSSRTNSSHSSGSVGS
jgi:hypothetical protein